MYDVSFSALPGKVLEIALELSHWSNEKKQVHDDPIWDRHGHGYLFYCFRPAIPLLFPVLFKPSQKHSKKRSVLTKLEFDCERRTGRSTFILGHHDHFLSGGCTTNVERGVLRSSRGTRNVERDVLRFS